MEYKFDYNDIVKIKHVGKKVEHLRCFIGQEGDILSKQINKKGQRKYKVRLGNNEHHYFKENELEFVRRIQKIIQIK